jgi:2-polyprenyl-3-methyl-5-hydroxy-6-metoxy-1,4-benzoquinol methylase
MPINCPICVKSKTKFLFNKCNFDIYRCTSCGLGITDIPSDFDLLSIYNEDYFQGKQADGYSDYIGSEIVLRKEFHRDVKLLLSQVKNENEKLKLLDIGSAYGFFLEEAKEHFDVQGLEVATEAVLFSKKRGLQVTEGVLDEKNSAQLGTFDIVTFLDVIEHVPNPNEFFENLNKITHKGSKILLTTGNFGSLLSRITGKHWRLMTPPQHAYFYTNNSLIELLKQHGFEVDLVLSPSKIVPIDLIFFQISRILGFRIKTPHFLKSSEIKVNLYDTLKIVATKA